MAHFDYSNTTLRKNINPFLSTKVRMLQISEPFRTQIPPDVLHVPRGGSYRCGNKPAFLSQEVDIRAVS